MRVSVDCTSCGGGLSQSTDALEKRKKQQKKYLRPCIVHTNNSARKEAIGVGVFHVGYIPPNLMHTRERVGGKEDQVKGVARQG